MRSKEYSKLFCKFHFWSKRRHEVGDGEAEKSNPNPMTILFEGKTGVGKSELSHYAHGRSSQRYGPFIDADVGTIPANLMKSELIGHEKGAFTGATARKIGHIQMGEGGSLFLTKSKI